MFQALKEVASHAIERRHKGTGDVEALVQHEGWRGSVPGGEGRRAVRHAEPAVGEGGAVGLTLKEPLVGQTGLLSSPNTFTPCLEEICVSPSCPSRLCHCEQGTIGAC